MRKTDFFEPSSIDEVLSLLSRFGRDAKPLAGGTDLLLDFKHGRWQSQNLVSITRLSELDGIFVNDALHIGSISVLDRIEKSSLVRDHCLMLAEASASVGSRQIRNLATIGGNICNALPCADTAPPLIAAEAKAILASKGGERIVPVEDFIIGQRQTIIAPDELLTQLILPFTPPNTGSAYLAHTARRALDLTVVSAAAQLTLEPGGTSIRYARLAFGNVAVRPIRIRRAEEALVGQALSEALLDEVANLAASACQPRDSRLRGTADYRYTLILVLTKRSLRLAFQRAGGILVGDT